jgi:phosphoenolpyruvate-protein phosphotransferase (PTS system enzyme I)
MTGHPCNVTLSGLAVSPGLAVGQAFVYRDILHDLERYDIGTHQVEYEHGRIERAVEKVLADLGRSAERVEAELNTDLALIFRAHEAMLRDPALTKDLREELEQELVNAEQVVKRVFRRWERRFRAMPSEEVRDRGDDVADLSRQLLQALAGIRTHVLENMSPDSVLVATRLLPSDTVHLSRKSVVAVVAEFGGTASHAALLTREMGIPAVTHVSAACDAIAPGETVLVDGFTGTVVVAPDAETRAGFAQRVAEHRIASAAAREQCREPATTLDGVATTVMANIGCREDAVLAAENGADGVGLYRLEQLYLSRKALPTEDELLEVMRSTLEPVAGKSITIRLLDVGADKKLPSLDLSSEVHPFLGRRGVRILLAYPELLQTQLRALARLSREHDIQILVPMVTLAPEMKRVRELLMAATAEVGVERLPPLGAMIETPAAALCVVEIMTYADFLSIGTNDLTQYTMAAGREDPLVSDYFRDDHPAVLRLVRLVADAVGDTPLALCGELAGRVDVLPFLLAAGIRSLSVAPPLVPTVKGAVRQIRLPAN